MARLILRLLKVAKPFIAVTDVVPDKVAPAGVVMASVTLVELSLVTTLSRLS